MRFLRFLRSLTLIEWLMFSGIVGIVGGMVLGAYAEYWNWKTCHQGHMLVFWREAYFDLVDDVPIFHPGRCERRFVCDLRCSDLDTGTFEAHPEHEPILGETAYEARCKP